MPAVQYPFIDIAVHERVRAHFAAGEAVVLFSPDMSAALWANGPGADLFGFPSIYDFLDNGPKPADVAFRQTEAAARQLVKIGDLRNVTVRVTSGFQRVTVQAACELIEVQGQAAVLFSAAVDKGSITKTASATRMIEGFDDPETHMAVLDENAEVVAASEHFARLQISPQTARMLVNTANADPSRLVKRPIPTINGYLPAAVGKPSDDPALYLLFTVDTTQIRPAAELEPGPLEEATPAPTETVPSSPDGYAEAIAAVAQIEEAEEQEEEVTLLTEPTLAEPTLGGQTLDEVRLAGQAGGETFGDEAPAESHVQQVLTSENLANPTAEPQTNEPEPSGPDTAEAATIDAPAVTSAAAATSTATSDDPGGFTFQRDARAVRFVWKIDADGRFTEVSKEFAAAVGPHAADINGMAFADLAALFHLDPDGKIAELLNKRDTWSGKTIWWPVEGTSLFVPVDLAALPTYTRTREFDGFRGFGIVRIADASEDPNATGLTLTPRLEEDEADDIEVDVVAETTDVITEALDIPDDADVAPQVEPSADEAFQAEAGSYELSPPLDNGNEADIEELLEDPAQSSLEEDSGLNEVTDTVPASETPSALDWPAGERPALRLVETAGRRYSDKVVQFEDRRSRLTPVEQAAFREIARQLDRFIGQDEQSPDETASAGEAPIPEVISEPPVEAQQDVQASATREEEQTEADSVNLPEPANSIDSEDAALVESAVSDDDGRVGEDLEEAAASMEPVVEQELVPEPAPANVLDAEAEPVAETDLSDRDLLGQMIPLRERIGLSADIIDQMPVALLVHAGDDLIHGNPEFLKLTGYASINELAEVGGLDALLQRQELENKTSEASGMVVVRADDTIVPVTARLQSVRWGDTTALMLALMPVAAESEAPASAENGETRVLPLQPMRPADQLARLHVEVEELRAILETATDGVVIIDEKGDIRSMNRAASGLFNYDNEEINGKPFVVLFAHESQRAILEYLSGLSGHGVASVLNDGREVIGREASGGFLPLFMTIGRLTSSNGYCAVIRDITQWKRTEEELRTAKRAAETANAHKSDFLAHVSHEIRTPLNAIIGFSDMMAGERFGPIGHPRYIEYANDIGRSGRHVLDIVNDLLDISKIEAGEMEMDFIAVGLNESISEAVSLVQPQANGQRVIIRTALSNAVPQVVADLRSVKQIVLNILSNAIRFTPSGGQIVVSTAYEANGNVVLRVRDTGIGMTRSELELAMKPFRQVAGAARKRGDGTGLGLPLTKAMVDANRAVFAISSAPNEGTLVEITFPSQRVLAD
ncbi:PAS domain S-box protein [Rhizobium deserti]|uniref:histidine kinase n=1 Tax=Rhizobium deserti TaxID=2547961 RepID=A0A4R5UGS2_9HYPH|nr:PAS domain-containing sensor histidine kinase [Rhizobium deserti]TDK35057.1 PAS domain S-box protein [Rhizobium deserti]